MTRTYPAAMLVLALAAGCAPGSNSMVEIDGRAAPSDNVSCKFAPGGEFLMGPGVLDVSASASPAYRLVLYVKNNLADPKTVSPDAVTGAKVWNAQAAKVRINPKAYVDAYGPNPALLAMNMAGNVTQLDGQGLQPAGGTGTIFVEAVSGPAGAQLAPLVAPGGTENIVLGITLEGMTGDGARLDSGEWSFPLTVCNGCLAPLISSCAAGELLLPTSCFGAQDSAPVCRTPPAT